MIKLNQNKELKEKQEQSARLLKLKESLKSNNLTEEERRREELEISISSSYLFLFFRTHSNIRKIVNNTR